jgi:hypothetical protein
MIACKVVERMHLQSCTEKTRQAIALRWSGKVPSKSLLWKDMVIVGTAVNMLMAFVAMMFLAKGLAAVAVVLHFLLLPYNLFLWACALRLPSCTLSTGLLSTAWLCAVTVI